MTTRQSVLIVDDDAAVGKWIAAVLRKLGVETVCAESAAAALDLVRGRTFDLALLDVFMPGMNGYDLATVLRANPDAPAAAIPLIFLTAADDTSAKVEAFNRGAVDFIVKPFEPLELKARVRSALRTQAMVEELEAQVSTDRLTGKLNRPALISELQQRLDRLSQGVPDAGFCLFFIDLDRFKRINDSLGHSTGDEMLRRLAARMAEGIDAAGGRQPLVSRLGGDEFVVLLDGVSETRPAEAVADELIQRLIRPLDVGGYLINTGASIGVRCVTSDDEDVLGLLRDADTAMYRAKTTGKGRAVLFRGSMKQDALERLTLEQDLRGAIDGGAIELHYQPIVSLHDNRIMRYEALVRWRNPQRGLVNPDVLIPLAEETGMIAELGSEVLRLACRQLRRWYRVFGRDRTPPININLSARELFDLRLTDRIRGQLQHHGVSPEHLGVELTESSIIHDVASAEQILRDLDALGIYLSIDDFGTGYSSLATLSRHPFSTIKIDKSFVSAMISDRTCGAIISATSTLAGSLDMTVVAEGVEDLNELQQLQAMSCDAVQGYFMSRPLDRRAATRLQHQCGERFFREPTRASTPQIKRHAG